MRVMDLGWNGVSDRAPSGRSIDDGVLATRLLAYVLWPDNESVRSAFLVRQGYMQVDSMMTRDRDTVAEASLVFADDDLNAIAVLGTGVAHKQKVLLSKHAETFGGGAALSSRGGIERTLGGPLKTTAKHAKCAGLLLLLLAQMCCHHENELPSGASLAKARDLLRWFDASRADKVISDRSIKVAWSSHKNAAHVGAAAIVVAANMPPDGAVGNANRTFEVIVDHPKLVAKLATAFFRFGTSFCTRGKSDPVLNSQSTWTLRGFEEPPCFEHLVPPLSESQMGFLKD